MMTRPDTVRPSAHDPEMIRRGNVAANLIVKHGWPKVAAAFEPFNAPSIAWLTPMEWADFVQAVLLP